MHKTFKVAYYSILLLMFTIPFACERNETNKDISGILEAWKTTDVTQTAVCSRIYKDSLYIRKQADTSKDCQASYMDFLGTLNCLRDYAKKNPSSRLDIRNTIYEIYGKLLYKSDKIDYLEAEGSEALQKAASLGDQHLLAELYRTMALLVREEPLRAAIYESKSINILQKSKLEDEYYSPERFAEMAEVFFEAEYYRDAIKYGTLFYEKRTDSVSVAEVMRIMNILGTSYMETNKWDSCSVILETLADYPLNEVDAENEELQKYKQVAAGKLGLVFVKWQQYSKAKEALDNLMEISLKDRDTANIIYSYLGLAQVHFGQKDAKKALVELKQARRYAKTKHFGNLQKKVYDEIARAFELQNQEDSASAIIKKDRQIEEYLKNNRQSIEHLQAKTELELHQIQTSIDTVRKDKAARVYWIWAILVIVILMGIIILLIRGRKRFKARIHRRIIRQHEQQQRKIAATELDSTLLRVKETGLATEEEWLAFRTNFSRAYPNFFQNLDKALGKKATPAYEKVATLIYLGMDNAQIGKLLGIDKDSVSRSKRRIKADMGCQDLQATISAM